jgi:hypothetical protein
MKSQILRVQVTEGHFHGRSVAVHPLRFPIAHRLEVSESQNAPTPWSAAGMRGTLLRFPKTRAPLSEGFRKPERGRKMAAWQADFPTQCLDLSRVERFGPQSDTFDAAL